MTGKQKLFSEQFFYLSSTEHQATAWRWDSTSGSNSSVNKWSMNGTVYLSM